MSVCLDAFATQLAQEKQVPLLTGDPKLKILEQAKVLTVIWLTSKRQVL